MASKYLLFARSERDEAIDPVGRVPDLSIAQLHEEGLVSVSSEPIGRGGETSCGLIDGEKSVLALSMRPLLSQPSRNSGLEGGEPGQERREGLQCDAVD